MIKKKNLDFLWNFDAHMTVVGQIVTLENFHKVTSTSKTSKGVRGAGGEEILATISTNAQNCDIYR